MDRHFSPCGVCLNRNTHMLYSYPARYFTSLQGNGPTIVESLVIPVVVDQRPLGTIWVVSHNPTREFDSEDARVLTSLSNFTAAALKVLGALNAAQNSTLALAEAREKLEMRVEERTQELRRANHSLEERDQILQERVTEIEALNDRLKRAMMETHHRVKNNLQVIGALIEMQFMESASDDPIPLANMQRLIAHIRALAVVHDLLTTVAREEESAQYLSAKSIIERLIPMLQTSAGGRRIEHVAQDVHLPSKQCTALALLVNELVSNAIKHGDGVIRVEFTSESGAARLQVSDSGKGLPEGFDSVMSANTGLHLVQTIATADLAGSVQYKNAEDGGAQVIITFPLPASVPDGTVQAGLQRNPAAPR
jgi:two-component sensor histidine kinase